jgi:hypothetical protein
MQIATTDAAKAADWKANDLNVKESEGNFTVSLRRKSVTKDGSPMEPVRVVDSQKLPIAAADRRKIGNGSRGNVIVWLAPYEYAGRKGVTSSLTAVQVTDLQEYSGGGDAMDFDVVGEALSAEEAANADMF